MSTKPILDRALALRRSNPFGQFGQSGDVSTYNGATGCGHTVWQFIIKFWLNRWLTHDDISRLAGYPWPVLNPNRRGLRPSESEKLIYKLKLPYRFVWNPTLSELLQASNWGPVLWPHWYGVYPNWKDYHGQTPPSPYARPLRHAGRNQFKNFFAGHASCELGYLPILGTTGKIIRYDVWNFEPNHDSPVRPENVAYDIITSSQMWKAHRALLAPPSSQIGNSIPWTNLWAFIPTKKWG